ncbi:unnamed protein product [Symbiodinium sp. KB8]|nr:unnamed protein product [Symbiodinium sp. KB8]
MDLTECYLPFRENVTCSVTNLQSFTVYQVRVRERCTDFIYDSDWGYSDPIMTTMPVQAGVPVDMRIVPNSITAFFFDVSWQAGASGQCIFKEWVGRFVSRRGLLDGSLLADYLFLTGAACLRRVASGSDVSSRLKQNSTYAVRVQETCTDPNANGDFAMLSENATTIIATIPADPPENLTVSNETVAYSDILHSSYSAYTFLLEFDAGEPYVGQLECAKDCYFTGWAVEVRENWTDGNFSNETNYTELNYSLWVPRDECKNEESRHMVRETCYDGYTELLDSDFSSELPDRQILVLMGWHVASGTGAAQESLSGHPCWGADAADSWASALTPQRCCVNPPFGDARCWMNGLDFDLCCTRWLHPRTPEPVHQRLKEDLTNCMQGAAPDAQPSTECRMSAYAAIEGSPLGRLLWCAIETAHCSRVFDVFIGSGCSAATAAAAVSARRASPRPVPVVIGFEDPEPQRAQKSHAALARWRARRLPVGGIGKQQLQQLRATSLRLRSWVEEKGGEEAFVGLLAGPMRPRNSSCSECLSQWALDCPERCVYSFGAIEAACEALRGVDLVFLDSDGSAADGWLVEWLQVERACAPRLVLLLNLSLPNHGAWIKERLLTLGYTEVWRDGLLVNPGEYTEFPSEV